MKHKRVKHVAKLPKCSGATADLFD